jgi:hypothetical protein
VVAQVIDGNPVKVATHILGAGDLTAAQLLQRGHGSVLQYVGGNLRVTNTAQDQRT